MGHVGSPPGAIGVTAPRGRVTLSGPVLADEVDGLLSSVAAVQGVVEGANQLAVPEAPQAIAGLQGARRPDAPARQSQTAWSPTARRLMAISRGVLVLSEARGRTMLRFILAGVGLGLEADELATS